LFILIGNFGIAKKQNIIRLNIEPAYGKVRRTRKHFHRFTVFLRDDDLVVREPLEMSLDDIGGASGFYQSRVSDHLQRRSHMQGRIVENGPQSSAERF